MNRLFKTADPLDAFTDGTVLSWKAGSCPLQETFCVAEKSRCVTNRPPRAGTTRC